MIAGEALDVLYTVTEVLDTLSLPYHVGGSFASTIHGVPRQTRDLDLVVDLPLLRVAEFMAHLGEAFYADEEMIRAAVARRGSFNVIHLDSGFKVDIFVSGTTAFDRSELVRHRPHRLAADAPRAVMVKSAEDTVLRKLAWYRRGGEVSDRQWSDVLGLLRAQGGSLDRTYLSRWAEELDVADLLKRALAAPR